MMHIYCFGSPSSSDRERVYGAIYILSVFLHAVMFYTLSDAESTTLHWVQEQVITTMSQVRDSELTECQLQSTESTRPLSVLQAENDKKFMSVFNHVPVAGAAGQYKPCIETMPTVRESSAMATDQTIGSQRPPNNVFSTNPCTENWRIQQGDDGIYSYLSYSGPACLTTTHG